MNHEQKTIGIASGFILLNIALMALISFTPLAGIMDYVFTYLILGVLFFGALLTGGVWIARSGIKKNNKTTAFIGTVILQLAYGIFGGGVLSWVAPELYPVVLAATMVSTLMIAVGSSALVYFTEKDFSSFGMYSTYLFLGVAGMALFGTFIPFFGPIAFLLALAGFMTYLIYEIYNLREQNTTPLMNGLGIYVAFMGVFVQVLQIVVRYYLER